MEINKQALDNYITGNYGNDYFSNPEEEILKNWASKLHWLKIGEDGIPELYLDNYMMSLFRKCQQAFTESMIHGYSGKGRVWFLDLGTCVHKMVEIYYLLRRSNKFDLTDWAIRTGSLIWNIMKMDEYAKHPYWKKEYEKLCGRDGFCVLMLQYAQYFNLDNERFRVIGAELYFGKKKEVPLLDDAFKYSWAPFRLYLSGKIDLLVDIGTEIVPMDHKTSKDFMGKDPNRNYEVQDGMTGYIFAAKHLIKNFTNIERRPCTHILMNYLQIKAEDQMSKRFKRLPIRKTEEQLEQYRMRMIATASTIFQQLVNPDLKPYWNTDACTNWFHSECQFLTAHRQGSQDSIFKILNADFIKKEIWNPETIDTEENEVNNLMEQEIKKCQ